MLVINLNYVVNLCFFLLLSFFCFFFFFIISLLFPSLSLIFFSPSFSTGNGCRWPPRHFAVCGPLLSFPFCSLSLSLFNLFSFILGYYRFQRREEKPNRNDGGLGKTGQGGREGGREGGRRNEELCFFSSSPLSHNSRSNYPRSQ